MFYLPNGQVRLACRHWRGSPSSEHDIRLGDVVVSIPTGQVDGVVQCDFRKSIYDNRLVAISSSKSL